MAAKKKPFIPIGTLVALALFLAFLYLRNQPQAPTPVAELKSGDYLFCFWNVENFFDDRDDDRNAIDDPYDNWFAQNQEDLQLKLKHLTDVLLAMKGSMGPGPDIIALAEVESQRAAEILKEALNSKITDPDQHYKFALVKEVSAGRHIAPAIITRLPIVGNRTRQPGGKRRRIIEGHIKPKNGAQLVVIASHWTSRRRGGEHGREEYANDIYGRFKQIYKSNPEIDLLVCGDFNDTPDDVSVTEHLKATGDVDLVRGTDESGPYLFNLMAGKDAKKYGTLYYGGWLIFDQIAISPGMLDQKGWSCDPNSVRTIRVLKDAAGREIDLRDKKGHIRRPWRFGDRTDNPKSRGYSDHFPVTAVLTLHAENTAASK